MPDISLGTINLVDFCGCGSPCPECCAGVDCCPDGVPTTLTATVSRAAPSACSDDIDLTYDTVNEWWQGTGTIRCGIGCVDSQSVTIRLQCLPAGTWELTTTCDNFANTLSFTPSAASCNPTDQTYSAAMPGTGCATCPGGVLTIEIME